MTDGEWHVVLGASGGAGGAVVRALAAAGRPVRAVTRGSGEGLPEGAAHAQADALDAGAVRAACAGARTIYHCVNTPYERWTEMLPAILDNAIGAAAASGATLVYCDNLYMYGPPGGPLAEGTPARPAGTKGRLRHRLGERLLEAHASGTVRAVIGRASDFFGPGAANTVAGQLVFPAVLEGRRAHWLGSLDERHSLHFIEDVGRALAVLGTDERSVGSVWHLPAAPALTGREFITMAFEAAGTSPAMRAHAGWLVRSAGVFSRRMREIAEVLYQFERPFVIDATHFLKTFGDPGITPMREAIRQSIADAERRRAVRHSSARPSSKGSVD